MNGQGSEREGERRGEGGERERGGGRGGERSAVDSHRHNESRCTCVRVYMCT